jgi:hypothetical protein
MCVWVGLRPGSDGVGPAFSALLGPGRGCGQMGLFRGSARDWGTWGTWGPSFLFAPLSLSLSLSLFLLFVLLSSFLIVCFLPGVRFGPSLFHPLTRFLSHPQFCIFEVGVQSFACSGGLRGSLSYCLGAAPSSSLLAFIFHYYYTFFVIIILFFCHHFPSLYVCLGWVEAGFGCGSGYLRLAPHFPHLWGWGGVAAKMGPFGAVSGSARDWGGVGVGM